MVQNLRRHSVLSGRRTVWIDPTASTSSRVNPVEYRRGCGSRRLGRFPSLPPYCFWIGLRGGDTAGHLPRPWLSRSRGSPPAFVRPGRNQSKTRRPRAQSHQMRLSTKYKVRDTKYEAVSAASCEAFCHQPGLFRSGGGIEHEVVLVASIGPLEPGHRPDPFAKISHRCFRAPNGDSLRGVDPASGGKPSPHHG